jgi:hypothetical protein
MAEKEAALRVHIIAREKERLRIEAEEKAAKAAEKAANKGKNGDQGKKDDQ